MPFTTTTPSRPRLVSGTRLHVPSSPERPLSGRIAASTSPVRTLSGGYAAALARPQVPYTASTPVFEPRVIRATAEPGCAPTPTTPVQIPASRTRRPSVRRQSTTAAPTIATSTPRTPVPPTATSGAVPSAPAAFLRPAYLEHSALRDLLYTDAPPPHSPSSASESATASRMSTPVPVPYPYLRRDTTPSMETDDESSMSASPPPVSRTPAPAPGALLTSPALRLPTRWSDQDRHHLLTVSGDGRELTFYGASLHCYPELYADSTQVNPAVVTVIRRQHEPTTPSLLPVASTTMKSKSCRRERRGKCAMYIAVVHC